MANGSTGAFVPLKFMDFGIVIQTEDGCEQIVINEASRRIALGKAFAGRKGKVLFCKTADEMTYDERGSWDMSTSEDRIREAQGNAQRRAESQHMLDMF